MLQCFGNNVYSVRCKIVFLDETELFHEIQNDSRGQALLDIVFRHLNLLETAYFGLRYLDEHGQTHWLDPTKQLNRQMKGAEPYTMYFGVKFYAADPCKLLEEITRYQFFLQIKQDILQGRLLVPFDLAAELGAYILQSELGDYDPRRHSPGYVSEFRLFPEQSIELEMRMEELHHTLIGLHPSQAEMKYLDKVKWLENYGIDLHPVLGEDHTEYFLGLTPSGIIVLKNKNIVGNYYWPRITKIYFKARFFMLRVTDKNNDECTYGFETPSKSACKHLWKCCVEHHAFFRLVQVTPASPDIFALGSRFRYSGRTEKQALRDAEMKLRQPPAFSRKPSKRYSRRSNVAPRERPETYSHPPEMKHISLPLPADSFDTSYHTTTRKCDSPRSTRSAPWTQPHSRGLYNNSSAPASPRSVRSGRYRCSSVDSQSSNDSKGSNKKRRHRGKHSDNESELSKSSSRSKRKHRRRRSKSRRDSESDHDKSIDRRSRRSGSYYELVDSGQQWQKVQETLSAREAHNVNIHKANVISSRREDSNEHHHNNTNRRRKDRRHRSRSRSPAPDAKPWISNELKQHLEFDLVDTSGMCDRQLKQIPYTVVETNYSKNVKLKQSNPIKSEDRLRVNHTSSTSRNYNKSSYPYRDRNGSLNEVLTSFSDMLSEPLQPSYYHGMSHAVYNSDNLTNFGRIHHEHSDSGLGMEQDLKN
ncbi:unnamed protein product [Acanthoscelides obtectus]|nr:unnamed protein product [Acanthoscelides obtectus]CAK1674433.1 Band 4.1-like protein 4A [Acanthoscelides obtectus]